MSSDEVIDLEDFIRTIAWTSYKSTRKRWQPRRFADVNLVFDWSGVSIKPYKNPTFTTFDENEMTCTELNNYDGEQKVQKSTEENGQTQADNAACTEKSKRSTDVTNVIFKSVFDNKSEGNQTHSLKAERQTVAICKSSITKGITRGIKVGLNLAAPSNIVKASIGYSDGFSINDAEETTDQRTLTWTIEGNLTVQKKSKMTAEVHIIERELRYTFKSQMSVQGIVVVNIYNRKNDKFIKTFTSEMKTILREDKFRNLVDRCEGDTVFLIIEGKCKFNFGVQQEISISEERFSEG